MAFNFDHYVVLYNKKMTSGMNGIVIFAYNVDSTDKINRTCTIKGRVCIKAYNNSGNWKDTDLYNKDTNPNGAIGTKYCVSHMFHKTTKLKCNNIEYNNSSNASTYNSNLGKSAGEVSAIDDIASCVGGNYYNSSHSYYTWWGGFYALTDEWTWTLSYGNDTTKSYTMSGTVGCLANDTGYWGSNWRYPTFSVTFTLPYLENVTKAYSTSDNGTAWTDAPYVWKTNDYGQTWEKVNAYTTSDNGTTWTKII